MPVPTHIESIEASMHQSALKVYAIIEIKTFFFGEK
jgi:hypothetical protein